MTLTSSQLKTFEVRKPEVQRAVDTEQVNKIFNYQVNHFKKYSSFFFTNPITFAEFENKKYILDGQHRLQAIQKLINYFDVDFDVLIAVIFVDSKEEIDEKYIALNQNKPVPLPSNMNDWKQFTRHIDEYFQNHYSVYFSRSERPQAPNFNKELMLQYINTHKIAEKLDYNHKLFIQEVELLNRFYLETYSTTLVHHSRNILPILDKARKKQSTSPFVLPIFKKFEWIDRIVYKILDNVHYEKMNHICSSTRIKIKKKLRKEVWTSQFENNFIGFCNVCCEQIDYDNFQCGHIISVFYNGKTTLSNLVPICSSCNQDMGIKNLETYKKELQNEINQ